MAAIITAAEVKEYEDVLEDIDIDDLVAESEYAVDALAKENGVFDTADYVDPLPWIVKQYAIKWVITEALRKFGGRNHSDLQITVDKYIAKLTTVYLGEPDKTGAKINSYIFTGTDDTKQARSQMRERFRA